MASSDIYDYKSVVTDKIDKRKERQQGYNEKRKVARARLQTQTKAEAVHAKVASTEEAVRTVTVCCKLPNGVILQLSKFYDVPQPGFSGTRMVKESRRVGEKYIINGNRVPHGLAANYDITAPDVGYALTRNIPKDFWDQWLKQNMDERCTQHHHVPSCDCFGPLKLGWLFAHEAKKDATAAAREMDVDILAPFRPLDVTPVKDKDGNLGIADSRNKTKQVLTDDKTARTLGIQEGEPRAINKGKTGEAALAEVTNG
jgi:hypothetical protein